MNTIRGTRNRRRAFHAMRRGLSLLDLLAALFLIFVPQIPAAVVTAHYGIERGLQAGVVSVLTCWVVIAAISCWSYSCYHETLRVLSEKYPSIYRVKEIPTDTSGFLIAEGAMIENGDYGWEAVPLHNDGLIYLQGLSENGVWCGMQDFGQIKLRQSDKSLEHNT